MRSTVLGLLSALLCLLPSQAIAATTAQAATAQQQYHVVELHNSETATEEQLISAFAKLGATEEKVKPIIEKINQVGKAVVVAGSKEGCEEAAEHFHAIGMKTEVRLLKVSDMPSEYDDSDVIPAGGEKLQELLETGEGILVKFYAPWCGHCKTMVPELKKAASTLKGNVQVAAVDCQSSPGIAQQLGIRGYPSIKWLQLVDQDGEKAIAMADYNGQRDADSFVRFAQAIKASGQLKSKLGAPTTKSDKESDGDGEGSAAAAEDGTASKSKLGKSKVGASRLSASQASGPVGVQKAKTPAEAEAEAQAGDEATEKAEREPSPVAA